MTFPQLFLGIVALGYCTLFNFLLDFFIKFFFLIERTILGACSILDQIFPFGSLFLIKTQHVSRHWHHQCLVPSLPLLEYACKRCFAPSVYLDLKAIETSWRSRYLVETCICCTTFVWIKNLVREKEKEIEKVGDQMIPNSYII